MPFFSIIIPVYNRYELCQRAINSVLKQTFQDYEILVIDDGSTDLTPELASLYKKQIRYIKQNNGGVSRARNRGIAYASGAYIALLDSDDEWVPKKLMDHKKFIEAHPEIKIHQTMEIWIRNGSRVNQRNIHQKKAGAIFSESLQLCLISPSAVVLHKDIFNQYGLFDESLPACEDYDLWLRTTAFETVGLVSQQDVIRYAGHDDQLSKKYWGMDRFRVYSILKLLHHGSNTLKKDYLRQAQTTAIQKMLILKNGASKRGNNVFAQKLEVIIEKTASGLYSNIDYPILLQI